MFLNKLRILLFSSIVFVSSLLVTWHLDFDRLGSIPFGDRALTYSLFFNHSFSIDKFWENAGADFAYYNGHYFSGYPPLVPVLTIPFLLVEQGLVFMWTHLVGPVNGHIAWALESWFLALPQILMLGFTSVLLFNLLLRLGSPHKVALFCSWLLPFTSYILVYTSGMNNDLPAAFLVFLGFYLLVTSLDGKLFLAGLVTSLATTAEYPAVLFTAFWGLWLLFKFPQRWVSSVVWYGLGALIPLALLAIYHTVVFGAPWHFAHNFHAYKVNYDQTAANKLDFSLLNIPWGLRNLLFSPLKGLFLYAPLTIFSIFGFQRLFKKDRLVSLASVLSIAGIVLFYSSWWDSSGGFDFGPRYLISTLPFLFLLLGFGLPKIINNLWSRLLFLLLAGGSFLTTLIYTFTGIRETIKIENWWQWGTLGRFESFFKVFAANNPRDVAPVIIRFKDEWPVISSLPYWLVGLMLFSAVVVIAVVPLLYVQRSSQVANN